MLGLRPVTAFLLTLVFLGCSPVDRTATTIVGVNKRLIRLPPPPGMVRESRGRDQGEGWRALGLFIADTTWQRWQTQRGARSLPHFWATAEGRTFSNADKALARGLVVDSRNTADTLGTHDEVDLVAWRDALQAGLKGKRAPIPALPSTGLMVIDRITSTEETEAFLTVGRAGCVGVATLVVNERALDLTVRLHEPVDSIELAQVRFVLLGWMKAIREANGSG